MEWPEGTEGMLFSPLVIVRFKMIFQVVPKAQPIPLRVVAVKTQKPLEIILFFPSSLFE